MEKPQSNKVSKIFRTIFIASLFIFFATLFYRPGVISAYDPVVIVLTNLTPALYLIILISLFGWTLSSGKLVRTIFMTLLIIIFLLVLSLIFVVGFIKIMGHSMEPNYPDGQQRIVNKILYKFTSPERGDVIDYKFSGGENIGRIVGLPGEEVIISKGSVLINGSPISEPYAHWEKYNIAGQTKFELKADEYLLLNDNRNSLMNVVRQSDFIGKVN